jgi:hypothetical protein
VLCLREQVVEGFEFGWLLHRRNGESQMAAGQVRVWF